MRIVVTGGAGFLGRHFCERILSLGHEVLCLDNLLTGRRENITAFEENPAFRFVSQDVSAERISREKSMPLSTWHARPARLTIFDIPFRPWKLGPLVRGTCWSWPELIALAFCSPAPRKFTAILKSIRRRKITGAMSTRSDREACTTKPSALPKP